MNNRDSIPERLGNPTYPRPNGCLVVRVTYNMGSNTVWYGRGMGDIYYVTKSKKLDRYHMVVDENGELDKSGGGIDMDHCVIVNLFDGFDKELFKI